MRDILFFFNKRKKFFLSVTYLSRTSPLKLEEQNTTKGLVVGIIVGFIFLVLVVLLCAKYKSLGDRGGAQAQIVELQEA